MTRQPPIRQRLTHNRPAPRRMITPRLMRRRQQLGITLLEALLGLTIIGGVFFGLAQLQFTQSTDIRVQGAANQMRLVKEAAERYAAEHYTEIMTWVNTPNPASVTTSFTTWQEDPLGANITRDIQEHMLEEGFLAASFEQRDGAGNPLNPRRLSNNPFNQVYEIHMRPVIRTNPATGTDEAVGLETLVVTVATAASGTLRAADQGRIAALIGAQGGAICYFTDPNAERLSNCQSGVANAEIQGAFGGFNVDLDDYNSTLDTTRLQTDGNNGVAALAYFGEGAAVNDYLYRYNIGLPQVNTMYTDLIMDGEDRDSNRLIFARKISLSYSGVEPAGSPGAANTRELVIQDCVDNGADDFPDCSAESTRFRFDVGVAGVSPTEFAVLNTNSGGGTVAEEVFEISSTAGVGTTATLRSPDGATDLVDLEGNANGAALSISESNGDDWFQVRTDGTEPEALIGGQAGSARPSGALHRLTITTTENDGANGGVNLEGNPRIKLVGNVQYRNNTRTGAVDGEYDDASREFRYNSDVIFRDRARVEFGRWDSDTRQFTFDTETVFRLNNGTERARWDEDSEEFRFDTETVFRLNNGTERGRWDEGNDRFDFGTTTRFLSNAGAQRGQFNAPGDFFEFDAQTYLDGVTHNRNETRFYGNNGSVNALWANTSDGNVGEFAVGSDFSLRRQNSATSTARVFYDSSANQLRMLDGLSMRMEGTSDFRMQDNTDAYMEDNAEFRMQDNARFYMQGNSRFDMQGNSSMYVNAERVFLTNRGNARLEDVLPNYVFKSSEFVNGPNDPISKPTCSGGGTPAIFIDPQVQFSGTSGNFRVNVQGEYNTFFLTSAVQNSYVYAVNAGSVWYARNGFDVYIQTGSSPSVLSNFTTSSVGQFRALARTYCYYP